MPVSVMWNFSARSVIEASARPSCSRTPRRVASESAANDVSSRVVMILNHMVQYNSSVGGMQGVAEKNDASTRQCGGTLAHAAGARALDRQRRMSNRITDGMLEEEGAGFTGRLLSGLLAVAILVCSYLLGVFSFWRVRSIVLGVTLVALACVWFPGHIAGWVAVKGG